MEGKNGSQEILFSISTDQELKARSSYNVANQTVGLKVIFLIGFTYRVKV